MFNNRRPDAGPTGIPEVDRSPVAAAYAPSGAPPAKQPMGRDANYSIINEWLLMRGDLESEGDILVKGRINGNIKCKLLIVDVDAQIEGGIQADEVIIRGRTKGTIEANKVRLEKTANVDSEISHMTFSAEEGAKIKGALRYRDEPVSLSAPMPAPAQAEEAAA